MKALYKRLIICSKSIMDIKVSNAEKSKNNLEKCMKVGPHTLYMYIYVYISTTGPPEGGHCPIPSAR